MSLTKFDKTVLVGCPWLFGLILTLSGTIISFYRPQLLRGIILIGSGLICMSLYCICSLLVKIIEAK